MKLDTVDWQRLEHAYGKASDLPALLTQAAAGKAASVDKLANLLAHQGWLAPEAALACAPFLGELARTTSGKSRAAVLKLLADLACGGAHWHFLGTRITPDNPVTELLSEPIVRAVRDAVVEVSDCAVFALDDRSAPVRSAAALLAAVTGLDPGPVSDQLAKEKNTAVRFDLLVALGWLTPPGAVLPEPFTRHVTDADEQVRAGAFIGLGYARVVDDAAAAGLLGALSAAPLAGSAWAEGDIALHATEVLRHGALLADRPEWLREAFTRVSSPVRARLGGSLVKQAFAREIAALGPEHKAIRAAARPAPPAFESLTAAQRAVLELLSRHDDGWGYGCDQAFWLKKLGFPTSPPTMQSYLGSPPPPPDVLDQPFTWEGHQTTMRGILSAVCLEGQPELAARAGRALAAALAPSEALEAVRLANRVDVPWGWSNLCLGLHLLVEAGPEVVPSLRAELARLAKDGPEKYWTAEGQRFDANLGTQCWVALHQLDRSDMPKGTGIDESHLVPLVELVDEEAKGWVRAAAEAVGKT